MHCELHFPAVLWEFRGSTSISLVPTIIIHSHLRLTATAIFLLQGEQSDGAIHWEEMPPRVDVLAYSLLLPGRDCGRVCDQLHGTCCRQFSHAE